MQALSARNVFQLLWLYSSRGSTQNNVQKRCMSLIQVGGITTRAVNINPPTVAWYTAPRKHFIHRQNADRPSRKIPKAHAVSSPYRISSHSCNAYTVVYLQSTMNKCTVKWQLSFWQRIFKYSFVHVTEVHAKDWKLHNSFPQYSILFNETENLTFFQMKHTTEIQQYSILFNETGCRNSAPCCNSKFPFLWVAGQ